MRWKVKQKEWVEGSVRKRKPFAFLPVRIDNQMVWFERYQILEVLKTVAVIDEGIAQPELQWVELSRNTVDYYY